MNASSHKNIFETDVNDGIHAIQGTGDEVAARGSPSFWSWWARGPCLAQVLKCINSLKEVNFSLFCRGHFNRWDITFFVN